LGRQHLAAQLGRRVLADLLRADLAAGQLEVCTSVILPFCIVT